MAGQGPILAFEAEAAPKVQLHRRRPTQAHQPLGPVPPGPGPGQQSHTAVAPSSGGGLEGRQGFGPAQVGVIQDAVGIHQRRCQPAGLGIDGLAAALKGPLQAPGFGQGPQPLAADQGIHNPGRTTRAFHQVDPVQQQVRVAHGGISRIKGLRRWFDPARRPDGGSDSCLLPPQGFRHRWGNRSP